MWVLGKELYTVVEVRYPLCADDHGRALFTSPPGPWRESRLKRDLMTVRGTLLLACALKVYMYIV